MPARPQTERKVECVVLERDVLGNTRIAAIGGDGWQMKLSDVLLAMGGNFAFYTQVAGTRAEIHRVQLVDGSYSLRTTADDEQTNNLRELPACPRGV